MLTHVLQEKSSAACALASWDGQLFVAWTGTDYHLNIAASAEWGQFAGKQRLPFRSYRQETTSSSANSSSGTSSTTTHTIALRPALAGSGQDLHLAWRSSHRALNVTAGGHGGWPNPLLLSERSSRSPALAAAGSGALALAWTGTDNHVNLLMLAGGGPAPVQPSAPKSTFEVARTSSGPAVCGHQGEVVVAWTGTDRHVNLMSPARPPLWLELAKSGSAPAVCSYQGALAVAWTGTDRRVNVVTDIDNPRPIRLDQVKSSYSPALCSHRGALVLAWTGTDRRPNLALIQ
jgi:hypothetical protein